MVTAVSGFSSRMVILAGAILLSRFTPEEIVKEM